MGKTVTNRQRWLPLTAALVIVLTASAVAPGRRGMAQTSQSPSASYNVQDVMIPMRDGVRLHTIILSPKSASGPLPFLLSRTPYGIGKGNAALSFLITFRELAAEGYIFVLQDIRGKFGSEGSFVMLRPARDLRDPKAVDEGSDTSDTIDWLLRTVPGNNGRAGIFGVSYSGWLTVMAMIDPHPALKAASEQASPADMYLGDDFHHNGAFRLSYGFEYAAMMEADVVTRLFDFGGADTFDWYLALGPLGNANAKHFQGRYPTWNNFVAHPNYDAFWQKQAVVPQLTRPSVPNLNVAGWFDQEDFDGPMKIYAAQEKRDDRNLNYLVVGPWNHGGWNRGAGRTLGNVDFGSDTSATFREKFLAPWFAYWLKDKGRLPLKEAVTFQTGSNQWREYDSWPPRLGVTPKKLYFQAGGKLSFEAPRPAGKESEDKAFDSYVSDPANPVPYRKRPIEPTYGPGSGWARWLVEDQRFVRTRPDLLSWSTEPLEADLTVTGDITARLFASTTGTDADWIVKLIDIYPEDFPAEPKMAGVELMIAGEVLRGRFRNSFERSEPVKPGDVVAYTVDLHSNNHTFLKGHRVMIQVQSTWFPLIDRNPQTFVPNIFEAAESDYRAATHRIFRSSRLASHVELSVADAGAEK